jgi:hypothetical protein
MTQQVINLDTVLDEGVDGLQISFDKTDRNFTELYKGAGSFTGGIWNFDATNTDTITSPVSGRFKTNSGNYRDATQIAIHAITPRSRRHAIYDTRERESINDAESWKLGFGRVASKYPQLPRLACAVVSHETRITTGPPMPFRKPAIAVANRHVDLAMPYCLPIAKAERYWPEAAPNRHCGDNHFCGFYNYHL